MDATYLCTMSDISGDAGAARVMMPPSIVGFAIVQNADSSSLFDDLDAALQSGSSEKRVAMLRQVTDLFLTEADRLNEEQIGVFDDVLVQLIERIETRTLVEISQRLAPVANAPIDLTLSLARHSEIGIARPILVNSTRLTTAELVEIAKTKSQDHLLAISERATDHACALPPTLIISVLTSCAENVITPHACR